MSRKSKYSDEQIVEAVSSSISIMGVMRKIGMKFAGGSHAHLKYRIKKMGVDTSHFKGMGHLKGVTSKKKIPFEKILVFDRRKNGYKENVLKLRRAMEEHGFKKICGGCELSEEWNGRHLVLQIDHKNGDKLDNRPDNLGYICPNCHSQTDTFCWKNRQDI